MSLQNSYYTIDLFFDIDSELTEVDWEEENDEEDKKDKETSKEKIQPRLDALKPSFCALNTSKNILIQSPFWEFNFDIHTPPPDTV